MSANDTVATQLSVIALDIWLDRNDSEYLPVMASIDDPRFSVVSLPCSAEGFETIEQWGRSVADRVVDSAGKRPIVLLSYCYGVSIMFEVARQLALGGRKPAFLYLIDPPVEMNRASQLIRKSGYKWGPISFSNQVRHIGAEIGLYPEMKLRSYPVVLLRSWLRNALRSLKIMKPSYMSKIRPKFRHMISLSMVVPFRATDIPSHLLVCRTTIDQAGGDRSVAFSPYLRGGYSLTVLEGPEHKTMFSGQWGEQVRQDVIRVLGEVATSTLPATS